MNLPPELIVRILELLDTRTLLKCQLVCKMFHDITTSCPLPQYTIELDVAGLVDRPSVTIPVRERLSYLRTYQEMFKNPKTALCRGTFNAGPPFTYSADVGFLPAHTNPANPLAFAACYDSIRICHVQPGYLSQDVEVRWWTVHPAHPFTAVCVDPGQDVMIPYNQYAVSGGPDNTPLLLQILSISSGESLWPAGDALSLPRPDPPARSRLSEVYIWGDMLAAVLSHPRNGMLSITVIGWKDGAVRARLSLPHHGHRGFRFASRSTFMIENRGIDPTFGLHLYSYDPDIIPSLDQLGNPQTIPEPVLTAVFQFPSMISQELNLWVSIAGRLSTSGPCAFSGPENRRAFEVSPSRNILVIQLSWLMDPHLQPHNFIVCIDPSIFQNYVPRTRADPGSTPEIVPWSSWGPRHTRWVTEPRVGPDFSPRCYGTRVLLPGRLLDFNPLDVERDISYARLNGKDRYAGTLVGRDTPTVLPAGPVFQEEIVSRLPFREVQLNDLGPLWQICPGEDWMHQ